MQLSPGSILGHYRIESLLGKGGMGEVYRAHDTALGRDVAIKVLPEAMVASETVLARFEREAKALATLNHPHVATLYGLEREGGSPFLAMELVEGPTLADRLSEGPLPWTEAREIFRQIAEGLEVAHEGGIVHRDLKPANIKLGQADPTGTTRVKILDFGLAKAMQEPAESLDEDLQEAPTRSADATQQGQVMGTAGYMSPEQARGQAVDKRTDIWAFGVCLFEALAGQQAFEGDTFSDRLASALQQEPDWRRLPAEVPSGCIELLERCLDKSATTRLRDIGEARVRLSEPQSESSFARQADGASEEGAGRRRRIAAAAILIAATAAVTALAMRLLDTSESAERETSPPVSFSIGAADGGPIPDLASVVLSPDGRRVVYSVMDDLGSSLFLRELAEPDGETVELAGTQGAILPFMSPDGEWVGFFRGGGGIRTLHKVRTNGEAPVPITEEPHPGYGAAWLRDGSVVLGQQLRGLARLAEGANAFEELTQPQADEMGHVHPHALPGDRALLFTTLLNTSNRTRIALWIAATGEVSTLLESGGEAYYVDSGHLVFTQGETIHAVAFDLGRLEVVGEPFTVLEGVRTGALGEGFSVSRNGTLAFVPGTARGNAPINLSLLSPAGQVEKVLAEGHFEMPAVSPDGRRFAALDVGIVDARGGASERAAWGETLLVFEEGNPLPQRAVAGQGWIISPVRAPDSDELVFQRMVEGGFQLERVRLDGRSGPIAIGPPADRDPGALTPDGSTLIYSAREISESRDLFALDLATAESRLLFAGADDNLRPRLSSDGRLLAYMSTRDDRWTLFVAPYPELGRHLPVAEYPPKGSLRSAAPFAWGPDGRLYHPRAPNVMIATAFDLDPELRVRESEELFSLANFNWARGFDVGPDGRFLMVGHAGVGADREQGAEEGRIEIRLGWVDHELRASEGK